MLMSLKDKFEHQKTVVWAVGSSYHLYQILVSFYFRDQFLFDLDLLNLFVIYLFFLYNFLGYFVSNIAQEKKFNRGEYGNCFVWKIDKILVFWRIGICRWMTEKYSPE